MCFSSQSSATNPAPYSLDQSYTAVSQDVAPAAKDSTQTETVTPATPAKDNTVSVSGGSGLQM